MDILITIDSELTRLKLERRTIKAELKRYPEGHLSLAKEDKYLTVFLIEENDSGIHRRRINHDKDLVRHLARKEYLGARLELIEKQIELLTKTRKKWPSLDRASLSNRLPKRFYELPSELFLTSPSASGAKLRKPHPTRDKGIQICSVRLSVSDQTPLDWFTTPYRENESFSESKNILLPNGLFVRSKSEAALIELCDKLSAYYHYDELVYFGSIIKSPDLIIMRNDGKLIYVEHCGLTGSEEYMKRHNEKLRLYAQYGIVPWDNLIVTYERPDGSVDFRLAEAQLRSMLLIND